MGCISTVRPTV